MTSPPAEQATPVPAADRDPDLVIARAHLRLGSLGLARAELETMAGRDRLDDEGIRDLAEARWRTGDITGAGEAAATYLEVAPGDIVCLVIAAEAQADLGRPAEARRLAGRAVDGGGGSLDPVFAGMKRSSIWPPDPGTAAGPAGVLFDDLHPSPLPTGAAFDRRTTDRRSADESAPPHAPLDPALPEEIDRGPGLWDHEESSGGAISGLLPQPADADTLFHGARAALDQGQAADAATGLILALRSQPHLAPAVLDLLSGRAEPILVLVRGDAQRIVGREVEAMRDYAAAADRIGEASPDQDAVVAGDPKVGDGGAPVDSVEESGATADADRPVDAEAMPADSDGAAPADAADSSGQPVSPDGGAPRSVGPMAPRQGDADGPVTGPDPDGDQDPEARRPG